MIEDLNITVEQLNASDLTVHVPGGMMQQLLSYGE